MSSEFWDNDGYCTKCRRRGSPGYLCDQRCYDSSRVEARAYCPPRESPNAQQGDTDLLLDVVRQRDELMRERDDWKQKFDALSVENKKNAYELSYAATRYADWKATADMLQAINVEKQERINWLERELERLKKKRGV